MKIPSNNVWTQTNEGNIFGVLHESRNISLEKSGILRSSRKSMMLHSSDDDADFGRVMSIVFFNGTYIAVTQEEAFTFLLDGTAMTEIASTPTTGLNTDAMVFNNVMYVTTNTQLSTYTTAPAWNLAILSVALTSGVPHPMAIFDADATYKLAIGNDNIVHLYNNKTTANPTIGPTDLILPQQYVVTTLAFSNGYLYVGTKNKNGGDAKVFIWDGLTTNHNYDIPAGADIVYSLVPFGSSVVFTTSKGELLQVRGTQAIQLGAFPVFYESNAIWEDSLGSLFQKIFHRGLVVIGDSIYISIDGGVDIGYVPEMRSGLWVYNRANGLYHRGTLTTDQPVVDSGITESSDVITTSVAHNLTTGDGVEFTTVSGLTGIQINFVYYVNVESSTTVKIAKSRKALSEGNYVSIGGSAGADALLYSPNTEFGVDDESEGHAIAAVNAEGSPLLLLSSPVIWGGQLTDLDGNIVDGICIFTDQLNIARFSTQRIFSQNVEQTWKDLFTYLDGLNVATENVIVRYRTSKSASVPSLKMTGTWQSTTTFNDANITAATDEFDDIDIGDTIVITDGYGRGYSTDVTGISGTTITVADAIGTNTKTFTFYRTDFIKIDDFGSTKELPSYFKAAITQPGGWIQLELELRAFEPELSQFELSNSVSRRSV